MRGLILILLFLSQLVVACGVDDDTGERIVLANPPARIVSLAPDLTEIVFAIGAGNNLVGIVKGSDYPPEAKKIPVVADYRAVDLERVAQLRPDLIVAWADTGFIPQLKKLKIPVYLSKPRQLTDIPATLRKLGCLMGTERKAEIVASQYEARYAALKQHYASKKAITVFFQVAAQPLMTITNQSWIDEIISFCGGRNIFSTLKGAAAEVSTEAVIVANPEVIIGADYAQWAPWRSIHAVQDHHIYSINPDIIARAGPRLLAGVETVCRILDNARGTSHVGKKLG